MKTWLSALALALLTFAIAASPVWALGGALEAASDTSFARPHDLVLSADAPYLYVSDVGNDAVKVLDPMTLRTLGTIGPDELDSPHDVVFDARGRLLVADTGNDRVAVYEVAGTRGKLVAELTGGLRSAEGVTVGPDGRVYVNSASGHTVAVFAGTARVTRWPARAGRPVDSTAGLTTSMWTRRVAYSSSIPATTAYKFSMRT